MRRYLLPALMITLLLSGCGGAAERGLEDMQSNLRNAQEICFTAEITADLGGEVFDCTMECSALPERVTAEVTAPETLAGIRVSVGADGRAVEYDGLSLGVGTEDDAEVSPVSALPLLVSALRGGSVMRAWTERAGETAFLVRDYFLTDSLTLRVWYDSASFLPIHCEFYSGGAAVLRCALRGMTYT